jgi:hypothetical protein
LLEESPSCRVSAFPLSTGQVVQQVNCITYDKLYDDLATRLKIVTG